MSFSIGHRCGLSPLLLWLWPAAVALIQPVAWEFPYAAGEAPKTKKKKKKKEEELINFTVHISKTTKRSSEKLASYSVHNPSSPSIR